MAQQSISEVLAAFARQSPAEFVRIREMLMAETRAGNAPGGPPGDLDSGSCADPADLALRLRVLFAADSRNCGA